MQRQQYLNNARKKLKFNQLLSISLLGGAVVFGLTACSTTETITSKTMTSSNPSKWRQDPKQIALSRTAIAANFIREHKLDDAKRQLELALESDPRSAEANDMMGVLLQQEGSIPNLKKAESYFKKAIELDPNFTQARNNYGVYLAKVQRYTEAMKQFEIAGSTLGYEGRADALENLGRTYLQLSNFDMAKKSFSKALDTNRYSVVARSEMIDIFILEGRTLDAKKLHEDLTTIIGEDRLDPRTLQQGARLARLLGNQMELQKFSQQLFDRYPVSDEARRLRIWLRNPSMPWQ